MNLLQLSIYWLLSGLGWIIVSPSIISLSLCWRVCVGLLSCYISTRCFPVNHVCLFRRSVSSSWSMGSGVRTHFNPWGLQTLYLEGNIDKYWQCQSVLTPHNTFFKRSTWFFPRILTLIKKFASILAHISKVAFGSPKKNWWLPPCFLWGDLDVEFIYMGSHGK